MNDQDMRDYTREAHQRAIENLIAHMVWIGADTISQGELHVYAMRLKSLYDFQAEYESLCRRMFGA